MRSVPERNDGGECPTERTTFDSVAETRPDVPCGRYRIGIDVYTPGMGQGFGERDCHDVGWLERDHHVEPVVADEPNRCCAEAQREHAIEGRRTSAALQMTEHERARLLPRALLDRQSQLLADAPEPAVLGIEVLLGAASRPRPFGDHHDAEMTPTPFALADLLFHPYQIEGDFRNQDHVRTAGDPGVQRDEPRVAPHYLNHHYTLVAFRRRVHLVDCVGSGGDGGIESERRDGAADVIVDRLRYANEGNAFGGESVREGERAVAP